MKKLKHIFTVLAVLIVLAIAGLACDTGPTPEQQAAATRFAERFAPQPIPATVPPGSYRFPNGGVMPCEKIEMVYQNMSQSLGPDIALMHIANLSMTAPGAGFIPPSTEYEAKQAVNTCAAQAQDRAELYRQRITECENLAAIAVNLQKKGHTKSEVVRILAKHASTDDFYKVVDKINHCKQEFRDAGWFDPETLEGKPTNAGSSHQVFWTPTPWPAPNLNPDANWWIYVQ